MYNFIIAGRAQILGYANNVSSLAVTNELNASRNSRGLSKLTVDEDLQLAASLKADDMFKNNYWSHDSPNGLEPWSWFKQVGYTYRYAGENLAKDFNSSAGITQAWLNSPSHKENMLSPNFENIGVAVVNGKLKGEPTTLVVAMFGARLSEDVSTNSEISASAATTGSSNIFSNPARINVLLNPVSIATLAILISIFIVSILTHWHYIKLPKKVRKSWYKHHALYTALFAVLIAFYVIYILTSGTI